MNVFVMMKKETGNMRNKYFERKCIFCNKIHMHKKNTDGSIISHDNNDKRLPDSVW